MRAFISLELPEETKDRIQLIQKKVLFSKEKLRVVSPSQLHITLVFLPDLKKPEVQTVCKILNTVVENRQPIQIDCGNLSGFPSDEKAGIIVLKVSGETKKMQALSKSIRRGLDRYRIEYDHKPFVPHITLARSRIRLNLTQVRSLAEIMFSLSALAKVSLYKSELTRNGPVYTQLHTTILKA
ncbi:MAG: RNA 2',3'-cyclic phosphodiesterase [Patescibacteria group bacterium]|jgi:2'-5' RNA ligase